MTDPKMSKKQVLEIIEASLEKAIDKVAYARINTYDAGRGTSVLCREEEPSMEAHEGRDKVSF